MLFKPKSEKVRVWVWRKLGKREVDSQSPWLLLAATVFRSTNSSRGSGKVPLSLSLIFPSFNFLNLKKKKKKLFLVELLLATTLLPAAVHIDDVYTIGGHWYPSFSLYCLFSFYLLFRYDRNPHFVSVFISD